jgi:hypothetical protein
MAQKCPKKPQKYLTIERKKRKHKNSKRIIPNP